MSDRVMDPHGDSIHAAGRMLDRFRTWWMILRISLEERLVYRGDFALGTLMRFLPIITQIFLCNFSVPCFASFCKSIQNIHGLID